MVSGILLTLNLCFVCMIPMIGLQMMLQNVTVHIYPLGEEKAAVFSREGQPTDITIVDNDNVSVIVTGYSIDDIWAIQCISIL